MNRYAVMVASTLVEVRLFLSPASDQSSVLNWIEDVAKENPRYVAIRAHFNELTADNPTAHLEGYGMAFELARAGYELGVQVGLRLRSGQHG